jgi:hypothetical protein
VVGPEVHQPLAEGLLGLHGDAVARRDLVQVERRSRPRRSPRRRATA